MVDADCFQMMYLALTYDHRLLDGREAVTFLVKVKVSLADGHGTTFRDDANICNRNT